MKYMKLGIVVHFSAYMRIRVWLSHLTLASTIAQQAGAFTIRRWYTDDFEVFILIRCRAGRLVRAA